MNLNNLSRFEVVCCIGIVWGLAFIATMLLPDTTAGRLISAALGVPVVIATGFILRRRA